MARRIHVSGSINRGKIRLDSAQAHHVRDVLRMKTGDAIEAFDDAGNVARGAIVECDARRVAIDLQDVETGARASIRIVVLAAVPKGERADWMIEKLSELGVTEFVPLATERSVVLPSGTGKRDRWNRIATESAKQSKRAGVMRIGELSSPEQALAKLPGGRAMYLSTKPEAVPIADLARERARVDADAVWLFIGPEGGWTDREIERFEQAGLTSAKLTGTILRVETAAIAAAAVIACASSPPEADVSGPKRASTAADSFSSDPIQ